MADMLRICWDLRTKSFFSRLETHLEKERVSMKYLSGVLHGPDLSILEKNKGALGQSDL